MVIKKKKPNSCPNVTTIFCLFHQLGIPDLWQTIYVCVSYNITMLYICIDRSINAYTCLPIAGLCFHSHIICVIFTDPSMSIRQLSNNHLSLWIFILQCSYYPECRESAEVNNEALEDYLEKYGHPGTSFMCLYNPSDPKQIIRTRRFRLHHVIHSMLWTSLIFVFSLVSFIYVLRRKGNNVLWYMQHAFKVNKLKLWVY